MEEENWFSSTVPLISKPALCCIARAREKNRALAHHHTPNIIYTRRAVVTALVVCLSVLVHSRKSILWNRRMRERKVHGWRVEVVIIMGGLRGEALIWSPP